MFLASSLCSNGHVNGKCIKYLINYRNTIHDYRQFYFHAMGGCCVKREGRHFQNICVLPGGLQESTLYLVHLSQLITLHCSVIFCLSESCQYYSVFPLMYCLKISFACHFCNLHVEHHNNISPTIKLCGEELPSEAYSLPL